MYKMSHMSKITSEQNRPYYPKIITRGNMKCPKKHVKDVYLTCDHMHIFLKCPKIEDFHFRLIFSFLN